MMTRAVKAATLTGPFKLVTTGYPRRTSKSESCL